MGKEGQKTLVENLDQVVSTEGTVLHSSENRLSHCCRIRTAGIRTAVAFALLAFALLTLSHCWHSHCWLRTGVVRTVVFRTLVGIPKERNTQVFGEISWPRTAQVVSKAANTKAAVACKNLVRWKHSRSFLPNYIQASSVSASVASKEISTKASQRGL